MKNLVKMSGREFDLPTRKGVSQDCSCSIFISTIDDDLNHYYYLINMKTGRVRHWRFDVQPLLRYMESIMQPFMAQAIEKFSTKKSFLSALTEPHAACYEDGRICITPLLGNFVLVIDLKNDSYDIIHDEPLHIFCSTKNIVNHSLYFSRWKFTDALSRETAEQTLPLEIGRYSFDRNKFEILKTVQGPDNIHDTVATPDESKVVVLEMPRFPLYSDDVEAVLADGIQGKLIVYDAKTDTCRQDTLAGGPGHVILDKTDSNTAYISCHNLLHSGCYGSGHFYKYGIDGELRRKGAYIDNELFRIPSHSFYQYQSEHLICTTAFPNQLFLINADTMTLKKKIKVGDTNWMPDFKNGPYHYPKHDRTPYGAFPIVHTPFILLVNLWTVSILNIETEEIVYSSYFNPYNDPISFTGHSLYIDETAY